MLNESVKVIKTGERTINKTVMQQIVKMFPNAKSKSKMHIPQVGYVTFIKDENGKTLAKTFVEKGQAVIYIDQPIQESMKTKSKLITLIERIIKEETGPQHVVLNKYPNAIPVRTRSNDGRIFYTIYADSTKKEQLGVGSSEIVAWKSAAKKV